MKRQLDSELKKLKEKLFRMGSLSEKAVEISMASLFDRDSSKAQSVIKGDQDINLYEVEIDQLGHEMIARFQPAAVDLRLITMALKITSDLERIGDQAVNIAEKVLAINQEPQLKPYIDIPLMAEHATRMVGEALDAFVRGDSVLARKVLDEDDYIDDLNEQIFRELLSFMMENPKTISRAIRLSFISKYIERIADHATNVAELVVYMVEGKIIRHMTSS